jgi:hypothetical protein
VLPSLKKQEVAMYGLDTSKNLPFSF